MLTEKSCKDRISKSDKVKIWVYLQAFVILGLVIMLVAPCVHLPKKDSSAKLLGEYIGSMKNWQKEREEYEGILFTIIGIIL